VTVQDVLALHARTLSEQGGATGLQNLRAIAPAVVALEGATPTGGASALCFELCRAGAFVDGNDRVAAVAAEIFLLTQGSRLVATDSELQALLVGIKAATLTRDQVDQWFAARAEAAPARSFGDATEDVFARRCELLDELTARE
jgi:death on curing protein